MVVDHVVKNCLQTVLAEYKQQLPWQQNSLPRLREKFVHFQKRQFRKEDKIGSSFLTKSSQCMSRLNLTKDQSATCILIKKLPSNGG